MSWLVRWNGTETNSDDFTIADLGRVEKESGEPWSTANVFRDIGVAKAFLGVAMRRNGLSDKEVTATMDALTLKTLKNAFRWVDDDQEGEAEEVDPSDQPRSSTIRGSSSSESGTDSGPVSSSKSD